MHVHVHDLYMTYIINWHNIIVLWYRLVLFAITFNYLWSMPPWKHSVRYMPHGLLTIYGRVLHIHQHCNSLFWIPTATPNRLHIITTDTCKTTSTVSSPMYVGTLQAHEHTTVVVCIQHWSYMYINTLCLHIWIWHCIILHFLWYHTDQTMVNVVDMIHTSGLVAANPIVQSATIIYT